MNSFVSWIIATIAGIAAWYVAVAGSSMSFLPRLVMWVVFWMLLNVYVAMENKREH